VGIGVLAAPVLVVEGGLGAEGVVGMALARGAGGCAGGAGASGGGSALGGEAVGRFGGTKLRLWGHAGSGTERGGWFCLDEAARQGRVWASVV